MKLAMITERLPPVKLINQLYILKLSIQWTMQYQQDDYRTILNMKLILTDLTANYKKQKKNVIRLGVLLLHFQGFECGVVE